MRGPAVVGEQLAAKEELTPSRAAVPAAALVPESPRGEVQQERTPDDSAFPPPSSGELQPSGGLPPAKMPAGMQLPPPRFSGQQNLQTASAQTSREPAPLFPEQAAPAAAQRYSGVIMLAAAPGAPEEREAMELNLALTGNEISGEATVTGLGSFSIYGKVLPRGLEMNLQGSAGQIRLVGVKHGATMRGRYSFPSRNTHGSWEVTGR